jgi:hypothetical protein
MQSRLASVGLLPPCERTRQTYQYAGPGPDRRASQEIKHSCGGKVGWYVAVQRDFDQHRQRSQGHSQRASNQAGQRVDNRAPARPEHTCRSQSPADIRSEGRGDHAAHQDRSCAGAIFVADPEEDQYPGHSPERSLESMAGFHVGLDRIHRMSLRLDALWLFNLTERSSLVGGG